MTDTQEKIVQVLQKLIIPIVGVVVLVLIASTVMWFVDRNQQAKISSSYDELFLIKKDAETVAKAWADEPVDPLKKDKKTLLIKKDVSAEQKKTAYASIMEKLMAHIKANQGNQVAVEGALLASDMANEYNEPQVGIEALQSALAGMKSAHFLYAIGQSELGNQLAKTGKCSEAAQAWETVANVKQHAYMAGNLRLKAGVCYEKLGMLDKAEKIYQDIIEKNPNSSSARTAKKFLLHIKFVKNKGDAGDKQQNG